MAERTIAHKAFPYYVEGKDIQGNSVLVEHLARRGETVDLRTEDIERGERVGAFQSASDTTSSGESVADLDAAGLESWITESKPNVSETVDAAGGDPDLAQRILDAENAVTGNEPRKGVEDGLTAIIEGEE